jgi:hypothetical protein
MKLTSTRRSQTTLIRARLRNLDKELQDEIKEAKRIQAQTGCAWSEALRIAAKTPLSLKHLPRD